MQIKSIKKKESNGLTLIELLVVVAILAILAGMSISALGEYIPDYRLQSAATELYTNMHKAKMEAIKRNTDVKIVFDVSGKRYSISVAGDGNGDWADIDANDNLVVVNLNKYNDSVSFGQGMDSSNDPVTYNNDVIIFYPSGACGPLNGNVYLYNQKNSVYKIGSIYTGFISMSKL
jgi:type IV fimbrial biogenesis protein FimT